MSDQNSIEDVKQYLIMRLREKRDGLMMTSQFCFLKSEMPRSLAFNLYDEAVDQLEKEGIIHRGKPIDAPTSMTRLLID